GGEVTSRKIAHFLILNIQSPRSLRSSVEGMTDHLDRLARGYGTSGQAQSKARALLAELAETTVEDVFDEGLHEFLTRFIGDVAGL
ncbi:alpha-E domain-containing protein, partial [Escherichia coli]|uniref:alpha-E domain-containing protein n=1 Tax=Escherichia coli TaxID=562 RepID=UPI0028E086D3